jgi:hypothetical protein
VRGALHAAGRVQLEEEADEHRLSLPSVKQEGRTEEKCFS